MDNSQLLEAESPSDRNVKSVLDDIIQIIRRQDQSESSQENEDRIGLLEKYKRLEELKNKLDGRFLFEYDEGIETLLREVRIEV